MVSRTTDDYQAMVTAGCRAVCEPAFWAGFDRGSVSGFRDYYRQLTEDEPARAAKFLLPHFSWLCLNPKEAEDLSLARDVLALIPEVSFAQTVSPAAPAGGQVSEIVVTAARLDAARSAIDSSTTPASDGSS